MPDDGSLAKSPADRGYTICANGRSGSNLLCQYLSSTGLLGHPLEFFNPDGQWRRAYPGLCEPVVITYEELLVDPQSSIDKVAALFGLQGQTPIRKEKVDLGIQRDALTEVWRARFRDEFRNPDEVDLV